MRSLLQRRVSLGLLALCLLVVPLSHALAATWIIKADGTGDFPTIQDGINLSAPGDVLELQPGTYTGGGNFNLIITNKNISITSSGGAAVTIIDCVGQRGLSITGSLSIGDISGITIRNAFNTAGDGGAIYITGSANLTIRDNILENNLATGRGGGITLFGATATIEDNIIRNNTSNFFGGGIYIDGVFPAPVVRRNLIKDNTALSFGGGIYLGITDANISENVVSNNHSANQGGGMYFQLTLTVNMNNNTLSENSAPGGGGGIFFFFPQNVNINNTIIAFSPSGGAIQGTITPQIQFVCCDIFGNVGFSGDLLEASYDGGMNISSDPQFCGPLGSCDFTLYSTSDCTAANSPCATLIGALGIACGTVGTEPITWGALKNLYRDGN